MQEKFRTSEMAARRARPQGLAARPHRHPHSSMPAWRSCGRPASCTTGCACSTASLLAKNLLLDWRLGEQWFWDSLFDADRANNPGNWQWVAGSGNDAAPYLPHLQPADRRPKSSTPDGAYVRRWVAGAWREPIVDLKASRERALAAFKAAS